MHVKQKINYLYEDVFFKEKEMEIIKDRTGKIYDSLDDFFEAEAEIEQEFHVGADIYIVPRPIIEVRALEDAIEEILENSTEVLSYNIEYVEVFESPGYDIDVLCIAWTNRSHDTELMCLKIERD